MTQGKRRQQLLAVARRWQTSTDTQETFARRHGLSRSALQYWIRQTGAAGVAEPRDFAPVHVTGPSVVEAPAVEIVLASGERVVVPPGASSDQVRVVLTALRPSC